MKMKFVHWLLERLSLPLRSVYSMCALYLTPHSLVSAIFSVFWDFVPIPLYSDNKTTCAVLT